MGNLVDDYVRYAAEACDAPEVFHRACGYFIVSTLLGRYCVTPVSYAESGLRPNIWVAIIGPSRIVRKTTAIRHARRVITSVDRNLLLPEEYSPEALYEALSALQSGDAGCWIRDELGSFFRTFEKKYMLGIRGFLSSLYSGVGGVRKLRGQTFLIPDGIYITLIGTVPTPAHDYFSEEDFRTGLLNRFIFVHASKRDKTYPWTYYNPNVDSMREEIINRFKKAYSSFSKVAPVVVNVSMEVVEGVEEYGESVEREIGRMEESNPNSLWKLYLAETPEILLKLVVLDAAAGANSVGPYMVARGENLERVRPFLEVARRSARGVVADVETAPRAREFLTAEKPLRTVYSVIAGAGPEGITVRELYWRTNLPKSELKEYVLTLLEAERIICVVPRGRGRGKRGMKLFSSEHRATALMYGDELTASQVSAVW